MPEFRYAPPPDCQHTRHCHWRKKTLLAALTMENSVGQINCISISHDYWHYQST